MKKNTWLILFVIAVFTAVAIYFYTRKKSSSQQKADLAKLIPEYNQKLLPGMLMSNEAIEKLRAELEEKASTKIYVGWSTGAVGGPFFSTVDTTIKKL